MLEESFIFCARIIKQPALKIRFTGAEESGNAHDMLINKVERAEYSLKFF